MHYFIAGILLVALTAGAAFACLNDSELPQHEREFRVQYLADADDSAAQPAKRSGGSHRQLAALGGSLLAVAILLSWFGARRGMTAQTAVWRSLGPLLGGVMGGVIFSLGATAIHTLPAVGRYPFLAERIPLPHHVPQHFGGVSLRFAMVHDVIHQRFPKHGQVWYEQRKRQTEESLSQFPPASPQRWPLIDDLAVTLDRLGRPEDGVTLLRDKLAEQNALSLPPAELYTTYANLGTLLIHSSASRARSGDAEALERFEEGLDLVRTSVEVNPQAHFGREKWQAAIGEFILASFRDASLLEQFDAIGNRLDLAVEEILDRNAYWVYPGYGRATVPEFSQTSQIDEVVARYFQSDLTLDDEASWNQRLPLRKFITRVGAEQGWADVDVPSHRKPVAFDEPVLGIIGMWRQGGGANPHFALALGETMLRVGQRYLAWSAYERAFLLADRFSPDPDVQMFLQDHCRRRQAEIEDSLRFQGDALRRGDRPWQLVSPPPSDATVAGLRATFQQQLALGQQFQDEYQQYEASQIASGKAIDEEGFFDSFDADRVPIASAVGNEDSGSYVRKQRIAEYARENIRANASLGAGVGAILIALVGFARRCIRPK